MFAILLLIDSRTASRSSLAIKRCSAVEDRNGGVLVAVELPNTEYRREGFFGTSSDLSVAVASIFLSMALLDRIARGATDRVGLLCMTVSSVSSIEDGRSVEARLRIDRGMRGCCFDGLITLYIKGGFEGMLESILQVEGDLLTVCWISMESMQNWFVQRFC